MPRGFQGVRQASADVEAKRGSGGPNALWFRLDPEQTATVRFLEQGDDIFWCYMHEVPVDNRSFGRDVVCINQEEDGTPCPGCEQGLPRRFKGFINLIWDNAPIFKKDNEGKTERDRDNKPIITGHGPQVAVWGSGIRLFDELEEVDTSFRGLRSRRFKIKRKGAGLNTKYSIKPEEVDSGPQDFTSQERELESKKYDLNLFVKPDSYDAFQKQLGGSGSGGGGNNGGGSGEPESSQPKNPFLRK